MVVKRLERFPEFTSIEYEVNEPKDGKWGMELSDGTWDGMIAELINGTHDLAASVFAVNVERRKVLDFTSGVFQDQSVIVVKDPGEESKALLYLKPYRWPVWIGIVAAGFIVGPIQWAFARITPFYDKAFRDKHRNKELFDVRCCWWQLYGVFLSQGTYLLPTSQSGRCVLAFWFLFCIVVVATYTGNLISFLAVRTVDLKFRNMAEMVEQTDMQWGTITSTALVMLFKNSKLDLYKKVWAGMENSDSLFQDYDDAVNKVKTGLD
ncbi:glutamate receptor-like [Tubulanus polymorphus]|uniref:glutamate receptor-like n=1 Tax=Tubulanus polymorphus TaxID=672921 RepID=UPI003DA22FBE